MPLFIAAAAVLLAVWGASRLGLGKTAGLDRPGVPASTASPSLSSTGVVEAIRFVSPDAGWVVVGSMHADQTVSRRLLHTSDGGRHWSSQLAWSAQPRATVPGNEVRLLFVDETHGLVLNRAGSDGKPVLYRTTSGGSSWQALALPGIPAPGSPVSFIDAQHGWLLADVNAAMSQSTATIFRTNDGGSTWLQVAHVDLNSASPGLTMNGDKDSLAFSDADTGWLVADSAGGNAILWVTHDGGLTWKQGTLPAPAGVYVSGNAAPGGPQFFGPGQGVLPMEITLVPQPSGGPQTVPAEGYPLVLFAYLSDDGGRSWSEIRLPATGSFRQPLTWQFLNRQDWWIASGGDIFVTHDGGRSWARHSLSLGQRSVLVLDFITAQSGWIIAGTWSAGDGRAEESALAQTVDDGEHWEMRTP